MKPVIFLLFILSVNVMPQTGVPGWAKGVIWYQIFPERFANSDKNNDPEAEKVFLLSRKKPENWQVTPWTKNWFAQQEWEKNLGGHVRNHMYERRYGGDIQGIIDKLEYIKELGVGAIYLNPVFEAVSLHKYDGSTYHHIDVNFGPDPEGDRRLIAAETPDDPSTWVWTSADRLFLELVKKVHSLDMKIIIDGVFNHTGTGFWAFKDVKEKGGESEYKDWYIVSRFDDPGTPADEFEYEGWWNIKSLPEFNRTENDLHAGPKQYIFNATKRWMDPDDNGDPSDGIDGWRLDVAREVPLGFWKSWRKLVRSLNGNSLIVGELWELSPDFISEEGPFDALMNYNFAYAVHEFFINKSKKITAGEFVKRLTEIDENYPEDNLHVLQNLMGSHDTERLSSMIENPDRGFDRDANEENKNFNPGKPSDESYEVQKLIAAFQMTYRGAPMIYYGDEAGMWGADDPHDRKPMVWDELEYDDEVIDSLSGFKKGWGAYEVAQNKDLLEFYKKLNAIHNENEELQKGSVRFIYSNDEKDVVVFERMLGEERIIAVFNAGAKAADITFPVTGEKLQYKDLWNGEEGVVSASGKSAEFTTVVDARGFKIFKVYGAL